MAVSYPCSAAFGTSSTVETMGWVTGSKRHNHAFVMYPAKHMLLRQTSPVPVANVEMLRHVVEVSEVVDKVLQWPFSGHDGLNEESKHGEHEESPNLELLHFKLSKDLEIIAKAQGVKASTWVRWVNHLAKWSSGNTVALDSSHQDDLCGQVVKSSLTEGLGSGLEPHRLTALDAVVGQKLWEDTPKSSEHCPHGVDHFKLTVLGKSFWVNRKPGDVPTIVTEEFTGEIELSLTGEWSQVLDHVEAVPRAAG
ncbi:hypothetical protein RJ640_004063 [Escallonia rubra]|uniref:Uncharacterized protein n=1 Tax=Escallonia rubra TaxID=112253 RepID=A0AA88RNS8_9ASTE|nr:hypothetical protein RJ640_004063 [Escallonia rubra]